MAHAQLAVKRPGRAAPSAALRLLSTLLALLLTASSLSQVAHFLLVRLQAPAGSLPESILPELRRVLADRPVHILPVLETTASRPARLSELPLARAL